MIRTVRELLESANMLEESASEGRATSVELGQLNALLAVATAITGLADDLALRAEMPRCRSQYVYATPLDAVVLRCERNEHDYALPHMAAGKTWGVQ